jgi:hypothetical protein
MFKFMELHHIQFKCILISLITYKVTMNSLRTFYNISFSPNWNSGSFEVNK